LLFHLAGAAVFGLIAWGTWPVFLRALKSGDFAGIPGQFTFLVWTVKFLVLFGAVVAAVEFLILARCPRRLSSPACCWPPRLPWPSC